MSEVVGHRYYNPNMGREFEVVRTNQGQDDLTMRAATIHDVITLALEAQFEDTLEFGQRADIFAKRMKDDEGVETLRRQLLASTGASDSPLYVHAQVPSPIIDHPEARMIIGTGKAKFADGRPLPERLREPEYANNLADIGDVYVLPVLPGRGSLQGQGCGSAIARSMLDHYPRDMRAVIYEYPELNPQAVRTIGRLGFRGVKSHPDTFLGIQTTQELYAGPFVGDLIEALEARRSWLRDREPIRSGEVDNH